MNLRSYILNHTLLPDNFAIFIFIGVISAVVLTILFILLCIYKNQKEVRVVYKLSFALTSLISFCIISLNFYLYGVRLSGPEGGVASLMIVFGNICMLPFLIYSFLSLFLLKKFWKPGIIS